MKHTDPRILLTEPTVWTSFVLLICASVISWLLKNPTKHSDTPTVDCRTLTGNKEKLQEWFKQYSKSDEIYKIRFSHHDVVMLPTKYMAELKSLPGSVLSFEKEIYDRFHGEWTGLGTAHPGFSRTIKKDLTHHTGEVIAHQVDECQEYAFSKEIGESKDWVTMPALATSLRIVALVAGRTFIGLPSSRDETWVRVIINHTRYAFGGAVELWRYPRWIRRFVAPFTETIRGLRSNQRAATAIVRPRVEHRMKLLQELRPNEKGPDDTLQWLMNNSQDQASNAGFQADLQLFLSMAAIHTTGNLLTQCLFNLAAYPQYQQILRDEVISFLNQENTGNVVRKQTLTKMRKLDSFIRESQRFAPVSLIGFNRLVTAKEGVTLSTGYHIPGGSFLAVPSAQVAMDPDLWENPTQFDGLRFDKLRSIPGNENKYQLVTVNPEHILFGQGTQACPGRFFASNEIKVILIYTVLNYDLKLEDGCQRPANRYGGIQISPDPTAKVCFRKRDNDIVLKGEVELEEA